MKILYTILFLFITVMGFAQSNASHKNVKVSQKSKLIGDVVIGGSSFDGSAILTVTSSTQGMLAPRMNTAARDNINSPADGLLIFNNQTNQYEFFETTWKAVGGGGGGNTIYSANDALAGNRTVTMGGNSLTFSGNLTTVRGINAASSSFVFLAEDNVGTDLFRIENDGNVGINVANPAFKLDVNITSDNDGIILKRGGALRASMSEQAATGGNMAIWDQTTTVVWNVNHGSFPNDYLNTTRVFVVGSATSAGTIAAAGKSQVVSANNPALSTTTPYNFGVYSNSAFAINKGGGIALGGKYNGIGLDAVFGIISGIKANGVDGDFEGKMILAVRPDASTPVDVMTLRATGRVGIFESNPDEKLHVNGNVIIDSILYTPTITLALGAAATTLIARGNKMEITGDGGGNTIATITGGIDGMTLTLTFVDALVTLTDDNTSTVNTLNTSAAFTSTANDVIVFESKGGSWREVSRSVN